MCLAAPRGPPLVFLVRSFPLSLFLWVCLLRLHRRSPFLGSRSPLDSVGGLQRLPPFSFFFWVCHAMGPHVPGEGFLAAVLETDFFFFSYKPCARRVLPYQTFFMLRTVLVPVFPLFFLAFSRDRAMPSLFTELHDLLRANGRL